MILDSRFKALVVFGGIAFIFFALWAVYFGFMLGPAASVNLGNSGGGFSPEEKDVVPVPLGANTALIAKGSSLRDIASILESQGIIRSASAFKLYGILTGQAHLLKPGVYNFDPASSTPEIIRLLVAGPSQDIEVLIREGETVSEIDMILSKFGIVKRGSIEHAEFASLISQYPFLSDAPNIEGFLFPDTYRFYFDSDPREVLKVFLDNFNRKAMPFINVFKKDPHVITTVASMIEREVIDPVDRRLVAGIIYQRLKIGMPLQIDATLPYAKANGSLYDTYKNYGLPPGPISNPGLESIRAALEPKSSAYLYYLSDPKTGKTIFSKTFEEHDDNRAKYLRSSRQ